MRRIGLMFLFAAFPVLAGSGWVPQEGVYEVESATNPDVCPQKLSVRVSEGRLDAIEVVYVGDCYYWGPFEYGCDAGKRVCESDLHRFEFDSERRYHWIEKRYGVEADLILRRADGTVR